MGSPYSREYGDPGVPIFTGCIYFYDTGTGDKSDNVLNTGTGVAVHFIPSHFYPGG